MLGDARGHLVVLLQQRWIDHQRFADLVEAFGDTVGRQELGRVFDGQEVDAQQIAHRVRVLGPVQTTQHDAAARAQRTPRSGPQFARDPASHRPGYFGVRPWFFFRGHFAGIDPVHDLDPVPVGRRLAEVGPELIEPQLAFGLFRPVATDAVLGEERFDLGSVTTGIGHCWRCDRRGLFSCAKLRPRRGDAHESCDGDKSASNAGANEPEWTVVHRKASGWCGRRLDAKPRADERLL